MTINKDLVEATIMLSFIILVLVGTSNFDSATTKTITMGILGALTAVAIVLKIIQARRPDKETPLDDIQ